MITTDNTQSSRMNEGEEDLSKTRSKTKGITRVSKRNNTLEV